MYYNIMLKLYSSYIIKLFLFSNMIVLPVLPLFFITKSHNLYTEKMYDKTYNAIVLKIKKYYILRLI